MNGFFSAMVEEMGKRRRRGRAQFGERGQAIVEFLVMSGLALGSVGLLILPRMAQAAPWGFAMPFVFVVGVILIEVRRQRAQILLSQNPPQPNPQLDEAEWQKALVEQKIDDPSFDKDDEEEARRLFESMAEHRLQIRGFEMEQAIETRADWSVFLWSFGCALVGLAAFIIAWNARALPPADDWRPPQGTVNSDLDTPPR